MDKNIIARLLKIYLMFTDNVHHVSPSVWQNSLANLNNELGKILDATIKMPDGSSTVYSNLNESLKSFFDQIDILTKSEPTNTQVGQTTAEFYNLGILAIKRQISEAAHQLNKELLENLLTYEVSYFDGKKENEKPLVI